MELSEVRKEIDTVDGEMVQLFLRRMRAADAVAAAKRESGSSVFDPARERAVLTKVSKAVGPEFENDVQQLFMTLMSISRGRQRLEIDGDSAFSKSLEKSIAATPETFPTMADVACPGAEGGYSQQAASVLVKVPSIFYFKDFDSVFAAVEQGMCRYGVLPIENSTAGSVTQVYDLMATHDFRIVRAIKFRIHHVLLAPRGVCLEDVREIVSHPHALAQCSRFLRTHGNVRSLPAANTAVAAAALAKSGRRDAAVIASRECAELYGLDVLAEDVSDAPNNFTRFILISKEQEIYHDANKFTLMMNLPHRSGALSGILVRFAAAGVNLTKLESRPIVGSDFEFRFIFDFEASPRNPAVIRLLSGLSRDSDVVGFSFLGAYPER